MDIKVHNPWLDPSEDNPTYIVEIANEGIQEEDRKSSAQSVRPEMIQYVEAYGSLRHGRCPGFI